MSTTDERAEKVLAAIERLIDAKIEDAAPGHEMSYIGDSHRAREEVLLALAELIQPPE